MDRDRVSATRVPLPVADARRTRAAVGDLLREHRLLVVGTGLVLLGRAAAGLVGPAVLGRIVDLVLTGAGAGAITGPFLLLLAAAVAEGGLALVGGLLVARLGETMLARLRERVVDRTLRLPQARVERAGSGDLLSRVSGDVAVIATAIRSALPALVGSALTVGLTLAGLVVLDWRLALAGLLAAPFQLHTLRWYLRRSSPLYSQERTTSAERTHQVFDAVDGARTARAFGLTRRQTELVRNRSLAAAGLAIQTNVFRTRFFGRLNGAEFVGLAAILAVGFFLVREGEVSVGAVTAAALYFIRLFDPFNLLLYLVDEAQRAGAALARLVGVVDVPATAEHAQALRPADSSVRLSGVSFAYDQGPDVVHDVDLWIAPGERVALVGRSGAGKTTVAGLIAGIHPARTGTVELGGVALAALPSAVRRRTVAVVSQEVHVFVGSLAADLRLARPEATDDELRRALQTVGAWPWVQRLPAGLATIVGSGGHRLDATQAQQVALARLVLADPAVAVLDEASAEAGSAGARVLEAAADGALAGRSALVVAHRLSQAASADRVVVMDSGRVVEDGRHADLAAAGGPYAALWAAWSTDRPEPVGPAGPAANPGRCWNAPAGPPSRSTPRAAGPHR